MAGEIGIGGSHYRLRLCYITRHAGPHRAVREFEVMRVWVGPFGHLCLLAFANPVSGCSRGGPLASSLARSRTASPCATLSRTLQASIEQIGSVSLIIIDPVSTAVAGDSHKNTEVRRGLQPLVDLATNINAALLGITHLSKGGQGSDPAQRVSGSIAFTAVARVVLVAARVQGNDGEDKRILARSKSNIGPDNGGFEYHLAQMEALPGIHASRIEWGAACKALRVSY